LKNNTNPSGAYYARLTLLNCQSAVITEI